MRLLIETQLDVLLARDALGRLTTIRGPDPRPAPRVVLGRSDDGNVWAVRRDVDAATADQLAHLCAAEPKLPIPPGPGRWPTCRDRIRELLEPVDEEWCGPAYVLPTTLPADDRAREISFEPGAAWISAFPWLKDEFDEVSPVAIAFDGSRPASVCHSARGMTKQAAEAGVETLEQYRGRGLATAAVACWARAVQRMGRLALYSTSWENEASQGIARRLSGRLHGENWYLR